MKRIATTNQIACPECGAWFGRGTRSDEQNRAFHLFFRMVAEELNNAGLDVKTFLKDGIELKWTEEMVKEIIWRTVQVAMFNKRSTTQLNKMEVSDVYEVINRKLCEHGISVPFPCDEDVRNNSV